jgi:hypothetical protein
MYCVIKCLKNKRVLKGNFASSVFNIYNAKTQMTQICVTGPQCVKLNYIQSGLCVLNHMKVCAQLVDEHTNHVVQNIICHTFRLAHTEVCNSWLLIFH